MRLPSQKGKSSLDYARLGGNIEIIDMLEVGSIIRQQWGRGACPSPMSVVSFVFL